MSEECTHDCSTCGAACSSRTAAPEHDAPNPNSSVKKVIGVVSGKGGVGKSMTSALLACAMARRGYHWSEINEALGRCGAEVELD